MTVKKKPTLEEAEAAVKTLIRYLGDNPEREGLVDTPRRVLKSYDELFAGYTEDPIKLLKKTFTETEGYDEMIILKNIRLESYCEHHMLPIIGLVNVAYLPNKRVVGISKLARLVDIYSKRLQIQEKLTVQIAEAINNILEPKGVAVVIEATHQCMSTRGVHKAGVSMKTSRMLGAFREDKGIRQEFLSLISQANGNFGE